MTANFDGYGFRSLYPGSKVEENGAKVSFKSEDSNYHVYVPSLHGKDKKFDSTLDRLADGGLKIVLAQEHHKGGLASDDNAFSTLTFDGKGKLTSTAPDLKIAINDGTAYHIDDKVTKAITGLVEIAGLLLAEETAGASIALAEEVAEDIKLIIKAFNGLSTILHYFGDDGGRLNFPAVIVHNMNKTCASIRA